VDGQGKYNLTKTSGYAILIPAKKEKK